MWRLSLAAYIPTLSDLLRMGTRAVDWESGSRFARISPHLKIDMWDTWWSPRLECKETELGGLVLDIFVVYLVRTILRLVKEIRAKNWPSILGTVDLSEAPISAMYPCTEVIYSYVVNGEEYTNTYVRGFWYRDSAERFSRRFSKNGQIPVRYSPTNPAASFLRENDFLAHPRG